MSFNIHFYIIFGTNILTKGPAQIVVFFAYFSVSQKRNIKRNETFGRVIFGTNVIQETWSGWQERSEEATRQEGAPQGGGSTPHPRGPLAAPSTYFFLLYISTYPKNIQEHHENLIPPPQPSISMRSCLGAFAGARRRGNQPWRASTSSPRPLRWVVSSLPQTFGSIVIS